MALTMASLEALHEELASAEEEVRIDGRSVRYRSPDDILKAISATRNQLIALGLYTGPRPTRMIRVATSSGF